MCVAYDVCRSANNVWFAQKTVKDPAIFTQFQLYLLVDKTKNKLIVFFFFVNWSILQIVPEVFIQISIFRNFFSNWKLNQLDRHHEDPPVARGTLPRLRQCLCQTAGEICRLLEEEKNIFIAWLKFSPFFISQALCNIYHYRYFLKIFE